MSSSTFAEKKDKKWFEEVNTDEGDFFPKIMLRYEETVYSLALCLVGDPNLAQEVVEDVFAKVREEVTGLFGLCLDSAIHRFTYDAALGILLQKIDSQAGELCELGEDYTTSAAPEQVLH